MTKSLTAAVGMLFILTAFIGCNNSDTPAKSSDKSITSFSFTKALNPNLSTSEVNGVIDETGKTIVLQVHGDAFPNLIATFSISTSAKLEVDGTLQESGVTSNDFSDPVRYTVTAEDESTAVYTVSVTSTYTVTFNSGEGSDVPSQNVESGEKAARPNDPQWSAEPEFRFANWYSDAAFQALYDFNQPVAGDITLYAAWHHELKSVIDSGTVPADLSTYGSLVRAVLEPYTASAAITAKYVDVTAQGSGDASSWANAAGDVKATLDGIADAGANRIYLVLLASGTYTPADTLAMKNHLAIVGGWDEWEQSGMSTISGEDTRRVFRNDSIDRTALLYGVTIAGGYHSGDGGGMYNNNSSPTLGHVTFSENKGEALGGGIFNGNNSSPTLINAAFSGNEAINGGGGMYNDDNSSPTLINVTFSRNKSLFHGGGMWNNDITSSPTLINVSFFGNTADGFGGGLYNFGGTSATLINVTFVNNTATGNGGGMYNSSDGGNTTLVNTLFWNNTGGASSGTVGQQIYIENADAGGAENMTISFSLVQHGIGVTTGATSDNDAADGISIGGGSAPVTITQAHNISGNPVLAADLADNGGFVQTMALLANSPAVNAGAYVQRSGTAGSFTFYYSEDGTNWFSNPMLTDSIVVPADAVYLSDARGYTRNDRPDIGAYEYGGTAP